jgi:hypothetical protein
MRKWIALVMVLFAFMLYFKDGRIIKAKNISIGQWSGLVKVVTLDAVGLHEEVNYYPLNDIDRIEEIK